MLRLYIYALFSSISLVLTRKDDLELPLCPTNIQYLPQELPMHCKMPKIAASQLFRLPDFFNSSSDNIQKRQALQMPTLPSLPVYPHFQSPSPDKLPMPMLFPVPQFPLGGSGPIQPSMGLPMPGPPGMPGSISSISGPMPLPISIPGGPSHKMPVIVMPFYSPDRKSFKKPPRRNKNSHKAKSHRHDSFEVDLNSDEFDDTSEYNESSDDGWWQSPKKKKNKAYKNYGIYRRLSKHHNIRRKKKKDLLTPILQYITRDGYVIFEKKITNNEAIDWLEPRDSTVANAVVTIKDVVKNNGEENMKYKNLEIKAVENPETEIEKDDIQVNNQVTPKIKAFGNREDSIESKEIRASPIRKKPYNNHRKRKLNTFLPPGSQS